MTTTPRVSPRALEAGLLFVVLVALSSRLVLSTWRRGLLGTDESPLLYQAATVGLSYVEFGFIRRGLGGTIVGLIGGDLLRATAVFHLLSAAAVSAAICRLHATLPLAAGGRLVYALVSIALMTRWAEDAGRTDMAVAACLGVAALAMTRGWPVLAATTVGVALCVHETGYIYGLPLLAVLAWQRRRAAPIPVCRAIGAVGVLLSGLALYRIAGQTSLDVAGAAVPVLRSRLPSSEVVEWALYFVAADSRSVHTSVCQNLTDPTYVLHVVSGLVLIVVAIAVLIPRRRAPLVAAAASSLVPYLFLCVVANDLSRWTVLAIFNVWLVGCVTSDARATPATGWQLLLAASLAPLMHPKLVRLEAAIYAPSPLVDRVAIALGGPRTPPFPEAIERCDPRWREVIAGRRDGRR